MRHSPLTPKRNQKQVDFLMECDCPEVMYGGAAGGGKSEALLMAALQFVEVPGYAAILFRKTYADLALPGALMDRSHAVLEGTAARWNGQEKVWTFPSGATLSFGYLDTENDRYRYQSSEFQYIGFDELTQFKERDYRYLFSRLRRTVDNQVPLRMRSGSNPGGAGHLWVKKRFLKESAEGAAGNRKFVGARIEDNPYIDIATYERSLEQLDSQTRKQLRSGDWTDFGGNHYHPDGWPRYLDCGDAYRIRDGDRYHHIRKAECSRLVAIDWAMGKPKKDRKSTERTEELSGDCTAFVVADMVDDPDMDGALFVLGAVNERIPLESNAPRLAEFCRRWEPAVVAGDDDNLSETMVLETRRFRDIPTIKPMGIRSKNKLTRSQAAIVRAERGKVYLPYDDSPEWVETLCDQLAAFTGADGEPDDLADCVAILGRLADEFRPHEDCDEAEPEVIAEGYDPGGGDGGFSGGW
jgi:phage terminase large subunit-like protein